MENKPKTKRARKLDEGLVIMQPEWSRTDSNRFAEKREITKVILKNCTTKGQLLKLR